MTRRFALAFPVALLLSLASVAVAGAGTAAVDAPAGAPGSDALAVAQPPAPAPAAAAGARPAIFPDTPAGHRVAAYFEAFNAADERRMEEFLTSQMTATARQRLSPAERLARFRGFKQQAVSLRPDRLIDAAVDRVRLLAQDAGGNWLEMTFEFEPAEPFGLLGIRIDQVQESDLADLGGPPLTVDELLAKVSSALDEAERAGAFSGVVLLARGADVLLHRACGLASLEYQVPNRLDTRFNLGSINKIFTRVAIEQLAEAGRLSLDDRLGRFLPDYPNPEAARKVTVRQLLEMTSGIGDFFGERYEAMPKDRIRTLADYLPLFAADSLLFEPGTGNRYSNGGYVVLGLIVEKASGRDYFDYVREHIYGPAGMEATGHLQADVPTPDVASGYTRRGADSDEGAGPAGAGRPGAGGAPAGTAGPGKGGGPGAEGGADLRNNVYTRPACGSSAGGGYSTAMDLYRFARALQAGQLLSAEASRRTYNGLGIAGGAPGINAALETEVAPGFILVVLVNQDPPMATAMAGRIGTWMKRLAP